MNTQTLIKNVVTILRKVLLLQILDRGVAYIHSAIYLFQLVVPERIYLRHDNVIVMVSSYTFHRYRLDCCSDSLSALYKSFRTFHDKYIS